LDGLVEACDIGINVKPQETNYMTSKVQQLVESHEEVWIAKDLINWKVQYVCIVKNQNFWMPHHYFNVVWVFFNLANPNIIFDVQVVQMLRCIFGHNICVPQVKPSKSSYNTTQFQKGLVQYNNNHNIMLMKKHILNKHSKDFVKYKA